MTYKKDDLIVVKIEDISFEGHAVGRLEDGLVVFVNNCVPGDLVSAKIKRVKKNLIKSELLEILKPSTDRVNPECSHFGTCNGCKMQNYSYEKQLLHKKNSVENSLKRIGGFDNIIVNDVTGSENIYYYRNKLEFSFSDNRWLTEKDMDIENVDKSFALGFHMPGFIDKVVDIEKCYLQSEISNKILNLIKEFFRNRNTSIYSTKLNEGYLRYLIIRQSCNTKDLMVNLVTYSENNDLMNELAKDMKSNIPEVTTLINSISTTKAQVASGEYYNVIYGTGYNEDKLGEYKFKIKPQTFFQTNTKQAERLFSKLVEDAKFSKDENVLDLYCGCGAISLFISKYVNKITGVESFEESIIGANENADLNNVTNCEFVISDVKDFLENLIKVEEKIFDTIIIDPPRNGLHPKSIEYLIEYKAKKLIYVSCNPTTQARDLKELCKIYDIISIQPFDMFPQTFHVENLMVLKLKL